MSRMSFRGFLTLIVLFFTTNYAIAAPGHTEKGTNFGDKGISTYAKVRHGPDGALFLDPYFLPYLTKLDGQVVLDAGCGAGPWGVYAAKNGAQVYGIDIQPGMIEKARQAAIDEHVEKKTHFEVGDVAKLPFPDNFFDRTMSLNVGCCLPDLALHIQEMHRTLKKGGIAIITAPTSFGTVFTDGKMPQTQMIDSINQLVKNPKNSFPEVIQGLNEVYRATFAKRQNQWLLILDENTLVAGEEIWRKIPMMAVPNRYHSENEYLSLFAKNGFCVKQVYHPHFESEKAWAKYNENQKQTLGKEYVTSSPFAIFVIEKCN